MQWLGVGYRFELHDWIMQRPEEVRSLEITAEHFFDGHQKRLRGLVDRYPLFVHGLGLSLGTPGPLCEQTLSKFARVAEIACAQWVSEHVSFSRTAEVDLGHLTPIPQTEQSLAILVDHAVEVARRCGRPLILENITSSLRMEGDLSETEFLNQLCERADCGLLLDVTNLFINSRNHGYDPRAWLREIEPSRIRQLHVVGYGYDGARYHDHHAARIQDDLMALIADVINYSGVQAVTLERDRRLEETVEIESELRRLDQLHVAS